MRRTGWLCLAAQQVRASRLFGVSLLLGLSLLLGAVPAARGQTKIGTAIGEFTLIEPSARIAAMGNAGVALNEGLQSAYYNPGAISGIRKKGLQFTHSEWLAGMNYEYVAASFPLRYWGTAFASVTALGSGDIAVRTVSQPLGTGEMYNVSDVALGLGFGHTFSDRFAAGLQLNYVSESIWHSSLQAVTVNLGTIYRLTDNGLQLGASIANFGTSGSFDGRDLKFQYDQNPETHGDNSALPGQRATDDFPVPILFRVGMSYPHTVGRSGSLLFAADAFHSSSNTECMSVGAEWRWRSVFSVRGGYQNLGHRQIGGGAGSADDDADAGVTTGVGLSGSLGAQDFEFDYAWADQGRLEGTHRFTFALSF
jgi:hypothetical protein